MKCTETLESELAYTPKTITITFDSAEEEMLFNHMIGCAKYSDCVRKGEVEKFRDAFRLETNMAEWLI